MSTAVDFRPASQEDLAPSGQMTRIRANLAAIRVLRALQREARPADEAQQRVLAAFSGWGALPNVFDERREDAARYEFAREALRELLSEQEYAAARRTTQYAHYTDAAIAKALWAGLGEFGFAGGRVLEPGCGSGNFIGFAPRGAQMLGVEMDPVTAGIAAALYPSAQILNESFARTRFPGAPFDAAIGNPPFGKVQLFDPAYNPGNHSIHNHFILKSLELVRPGGLVAVVTSRYTLDGALDGLAARSRMAQMAQLVGAVRLPSEAHRRAAGTDVITDLLVLRRREAEVSEQVARKDAEPWRERFLLPTPEPVEEAGKEKESAPPPRVWVNEYFARHPETVLGNMVVGNGMYRKDLEVEAFTHRPLDEQIAQVLGAAAQRARERGLLMAEATPAQRTAMQASRERERYQGPDAEAMEGLIIARADGTFGVVAGGWIDPHACPTTQAPELRALIALRQAVGDLMAVEQSDVPDEDARMAELRAALNTRYDAHLRAFGPINRGSLYNTGALDEDGEPVVGRRNPPQGGFRNDPYAGNVMALEIFDEQSGAAEKAPIFRERVQRQRRIPERADTPEDALRFAVEAHGEVRLEHVALLLGLASPEAAREALGALVFEDPDSGQIVPAQEYLSGNVRGKLQSAVLAAKDDPRFEDNARALREVLPADLTAGDITARLGASWIEPQYFAQFLRETLDDRFLTIKHGVGNTWKLEGQKSTELATRVWGTREWDAIKLALALLNSGPIRVYPRFPPDREVSAWERARIEQNALDATVAAQSKAEELNAEFNAWLWRDPERAAQHVETYNWRFNYHVQRDYSHAQLTLPGMSAAFTLRPHQLAAVARILSEPAVLLAHEVGAGKTLEMIAGAMELRRLALANKPALVVPNHMLGQIQREFLQAYPGARVLAVSSEDLEGRKRRAFTARVALGAHDAVIMTHSLFTQLRMSEHAREGFVASQLKHYDDYLREHRGDPDAEKQDSIVKRVEKQRENTENRLTKSISGKRDPGLSFEQLGVDYLFVDEAHLFKNLKLDTRASELSPAGSARAADLEMKLHYLRSTHGRRVATFATATPTANSIAETYIMMRYLRPELLHAAGFISFDDWVTHHTQKSTSIEIAPEGGIRTKTRIAKFINTPELISMFRAVADVKTAQDLNLPVPKIVGGAPEMVDVAPIPAVLRYMRSIQRRAEAIRAKLVEPEEDNLLKITTQGTQLGIDTRLVGIEPDGPQKLDVAADKIAGIWHQTKDFAYRDERRLPSPERGALQLVFCDWGVPNADARAQGRWTTYDYLKEQLVARGLPPEKIRFMHEAGDKSEAKQALFADARNGKIAVLIGSTALMGVGTNVQARAIALHHMDCDWRPDIIQQREGRIVRQLNQNAEVRILRYVTKRSLDAYRWQTVARKAAFIDQVMRGSAVARDMEEPASEQALSYEELTALAADNQTLMEKARVDKELRDLTSLQARHALTQQDFARIVEKQSEQIEQLTAQTPKYDAAAAAYVPTRGDAFAMTIDGQRYDKRPEAGLELRERIIGHIESVGRAPRTLGALGGYELVGAVKAGFERGSAYYSIAFAGTELSPLNLGLSEARTNKPLGLISRLENRAERAAHNLAWHLEQLEFARRQLETAQSNLGKPFPHTARFEELRAEAETLAAQLAATADQDAPKPLDLAEVFDAQTRYTYTNGDAQRRATGNELAERLAQLVTAGANAELTHGHFVLTHLSGRELYVEPTSPEEAERWLALSPAPPDPAATEDEDEPAAQETQPAPAAPEPVLRPPVFDEHAPNSLPYEDRAAQRAAEEHIAALLEAWHTGPGADAALAAAGYDVAAESQRRRAQRAQRGHDESADYDAAMLWSPLGEILRAHAETIGDQDAARLADAVEEHVERFQAIFAVGTDSFETWARSPEPAYDPDNTPPAPESQPHRPPPPATRDNAPAPPAPAVAISPPATTITAGPGENATPPAAPEPPPGAAGEGAAQLDLFAATTAGRAAAPPTAPGDRGAQPPPPREGDIGAAPTPPQPETAPTKAPAPQAQPGQAAPASAQEFPARPHPANDPAQAAEPPQPPAPAPQPAAGAKTPEPLLARSLRMIPQLCDEQEHWWSGNSLARALGGDPRIVAFTRAWRTLRKQASTSDAEQIEATAGVLLKAARTAHATSDTVMNLHRRHGERRDRHGLLATTQRLSEVIHQLERFAGPRADPATAQDPYGQGEARSADAALGRRVTWLQERLKGPARLEIADSWPTATRAATGWGATPRAQDAAAEYEQAAATLARIDAQAPEGWRGEEARWLIERVLHDAAVHTARLHATAAAAAADTAPAATAPAQPQATETVEGTSTPTQAAAAQPVTAPDWQDARVIRIAHPVSGRTVLHGTVRQETAPLKDIIDSLAGAKWAPTQRAWVLPTTWKLETRSGRVNHLVAELAAIGYPFELDPPPAAPPQPIALYSAPDGSPEPPAGVRHTQVTFPALAVGRGEPGLIHADGTPIAVLFREAGTVERTGTAAGFVTWGTFTSMPNQVVRWEDGTYSHVHPNSIRALPAPAPATQPPPIAAAPADEPSQSPPALEEQHAETAAPPPAPAPAPAPVLGEIRDGYPDPHTALEASAHLNRLIRAWAATPTGLRMAAERGEPTAAAFHLAWDAVTAAEPGVSQSLYITAADATARLSERVESDPRASADERELYARLREAAARHAARLGTPVPGAPEQAVAGALPPESQYSRRGHGFYPPPDQLAGIPRLYATDAQTPGDVTVKAHYFAPDADWYITELAQRGEDTAIAFGWAVHGQGQPELGTVNLAELEALNASGVIVERDLHLRPGPARDVVPRIPDWALEPEPEQQQDPAAAQQDPAPTPMPVPEPEFPPAATAAGPGNEPARVDAIPDTGPGEREEPAAPALPQALARPAAEVFDENALMGARLGASGRLQQLLMIRSADGVLNDAGYARARGQRTVRPAMSFLRDERSYANNANGAPISAAELIERHRRLRDTLASWQAYLAANPKTRGGRLLTNGVIDARRGAESALGILTRALEEQGETHAAAPAPTTRPPGPARTTPEQPPPGAAQLDLFSTAGQPAAPTTEPGERGAQPPAPQDADISAAPAPPRSDAVSTQPPAPQAQPAQAAAASAQGEQMPPQNAENPLGEAAPTEVALPADAQALAVALLFAAPGLARAAAAALGPAAFSDRELGIAFNIGIERIARRGRVGTLDQHFRELIALSAWGSLNELRARVDTAWHAAGLDDPARHEAARAAVVAALAPRAAGDFKTPAPELAPAASPAQPQKVETAPTPARPAAAQPTPVPDLPEAIAARDGAEPYTDSLDLVLAEHALRTYQTHTPWRRAEDPRRELGYWIWVHREDAERLAASGTHPAGLSAESVYVRSAEHAARLLATEKAGTLPALLADADLDLPRAEAGAAAPDIRVRLHRTLQEGGAVWFAYGLPSGHPAADVLSRYGAPSDESWRWTVAHRNGAADQLAQRLLALEIPVTTSGLATAPPRLLDGPPTSTAQAPGALPVKYPYALGVEDAEPRVLHADGTKLAVSWGRPGHPSHGAAAGTAAGRTQSDRQLVRWADGSASSIDPRALTPTEQEPTPAPVLRADLIERFFDSRALNGAFLAASEGLLGALVREPAALEAVGEHLGDQTRFPGHRVIRRAGYLISEGAAPAAALIARIEADHPDPAEALHAIADLHERALRAEYSAMEYAQQLTTLGHFGDAMRELRPAITAGRLTQWLEQQRESTGFEPDENQAMLLADLSNEVASWGYLSSALDDPGRLWPFERAFGRDQGARILRELPELLAGRGAIRQESDAALPLWPDTVAQPAAPYTPRAVAEVREPASTPQFLARLEQGINERTRAIAAARKLRESINPDGSQAPFTATIGAESTDDRARANELLVQALRQAHDSFMGGELSKGARRGALARTATVALGTLRGAPLEVRLQRGPAPRGTPAPIEVALAIAGTDNTVQILDSMLSRLVPEAESLRNRAEYEASAAIAEGQSALDTIRTDLARLHAAPPPGEPAPQPAPHQAPAQTQIPDNTRPGSQQAQAPAFAGKQAADGPGEPKKAADADDRGEPRQSPLPIHAADEPPTAGQATNPPDAPRDHPVEPQSDAAPTKPPAGQEGPREPAAGGERVTLLLTVTQANQVQEMRISNRAPRTLISARAEDGATYLWGTSSFSPPAVGARITVTATLAPSGADQGHGHARGIGPLDTRTTLTAVRWAPAPAPTDNGDSPHPSRELPSPQRSQVREPGPMPTARADEPPAAPAPEAPPAQPYPDRAAYRAGQEATARAFWRWTTNEGAVTRREGAEGAISELQMRGADVINSEVDARRAFERRRAIPSVPHQRGDDVRADLERQSELVARARRVLDLPGYLYSGSLAAFADAAHEHARRIDATLSDEAHFARFAASEEPAYDPLTLLDDELLYGLDARDYLNEAPQPARVLAPAQAREFLAALAPEQIEGNWGALRFPDSHGNPQLLRPLQPQAAPAWLAARSASPGPQHTDTAEATDPQVPADTPEPAAHQTPAQTQRPGIRQTEASASAGERAADDPGEPQKAADADDRGEPRESAFSVPTAGALPAADQAPDAPQDRPPAPPEEAPPSAAPGPDPAPAFPPAFHTLPALERARHLASRGFHLTPIAPRSKVPLIPNISWLEAATNDPAQIEDLFKAHPRANIAIPCKTNHLFVIDLDRDKNPGNDPPRHGADTLAALAAGRPIPRTFTVQSPHGGWHLYFRAPDGITLPSTVGNTGKGLGPNIDTRADKPDGDGNYIIAPGSMVDSRPYTVVRDEPIADLPDWLLRELLALRPAEAPLPERPRTRAVNEVPANRTEAYGQAALQNAVTEVASLTEGSRNDRLNAIAYSLGRKVGASILARQDVIDDLTWAAQAAGLTEREARTTINSGLSAGEQQPRGIPDRAIPTAPRAGADAHRNPQAAPQSEPPQAPQARQEAEMTADQLTVALLARPPALPDLDQHNPAEALARADATLKALRALWSASPDMLEIPEHLHDQVRHWWAHAGHEATQRLEGPEAQLIADRSIRDGQTEDPHHQWAEPDADDHADQPEPPDPQDEYELYEGSLSWEEWLAQHGQPAEEPADGYDNGYDEDYAYLPPRPDPPHTYEPPAETTAHSAQPPAPAEPHPAEDEPATTAKPLPVPAEKHPHPDPAPDPAPAVSPGTFEIIRAALDAYRAAAADQSAPAGAPISPDLDIPERDQLAQAIDAAAQHTDDYRDTPQWAQLTKAWESTKRLWADAAAAVANYGLDLYADARYHDLMRASAIRTADAITRLAARLAQHLATTGHGQSAPHSALTTLSRTAQNFAGKLRGRTPAERAETAERLASINALTDQARQLRTQLAAQPAPDLSDPGWSPTPTIDLKPVEQAMTQAYGHDTEYNNAQEWAQIKALWHAGTALRPPGPGQAAEPAHDGIARAAALRSVDALAHLALRFADRLAQHGHHTTPGHRAQLALALASHTTGHRMRADDPKARTKATTAITRVLSDIDTLITDLNTIEINPADLSATRTTATSRTATADQGTARAPTTASAPPARRAAGR